MRVGSLFSGIGGIDLGLMRAGMEIAWQVEIDPWCRKVLAKHWPEVKRYADIRDCGKHNLASVDVIAGGFPCQDISNAGQREGIDGERSGLWREMWRVIGELRPRYVLVENVAALLGRGMGRVIGDLAAIGYDAEWQIISAADVGAPHLRERVWIVAYPMWDGSAPRFANKATGKKGNTTIVNDGSTYMADADRHIRYGWFSPLQMGRLWSEREAALDGHTGGTQWAVEPNVGRVAHGIPRRVDRLRGLGNAVVPQIPELIGREIIRVAMQ